MSTAAALPVDGARPAWRPAANPWLVALVVTLATFMEILDTSIANVALPHIAGSLSASNEEATWVLTSYLVANAIVLPLSAWFSALIGRKRFYMLCVFLFTASSALCGMAPSLGTLIFLRVVQGAAGGGLQPSEQAILVDTFPPKKLPMGMAVYGVAVVVAPVLGPVLGGWITDNISWRWIFLINVPVGVLSLFLTSQFVEDPPHQRRRSFRDGLRIDYIGFGLIAVGLGFLQIMLDKGQQEDWFASSFIRVCAVLTALGIVGAVVWELRVKDPVVDLHLLKDRNFLAAQALMFMCGFVLYGSTVLLPIFVQTMLGYNATLSGLVLSPGGLVVMFSLPFIGLLLQRFQARWLLGVGLIITGTSLLHMARFTLQIDLGTATWARVYQSLGLGFLFLPINTAAYNGIPREKNNSAAGLINLFRNIGGSVGISFAMTLLTRRMQHHQGNLAFHTNVFNEPFRLAKEQATGMFAGVFGNLEQATDAAHAVLYGLLRREAAMRAYVDVFFVLGVVFLAMIPFIFLLRRTTPGKTPLGVH